MWTFFSSLLHCPLVTRPWQWAPQVPDFAASDHIIRPGAWIETGCLLFRHKLFSYHFISSDWYWSGSGSTVWYVEFNIPNTLTISLRLTWSTFRSVSQRDIIFSFFSSGKKIVMDSKFKINSKNSIILLGSMQDFYLFITKPRFLSMKITTSLSRSTYSIAPSILKRYYIGILQDGFALFALKILDFWKFYKNSEKWHISCCSYEVECWNMRPEGPVLP